MNSSAVYRKEEGESWEGGREQRKKRGKRRGEGLGSICLSLKFPPHVISPGGKNERGRKVRKRKRKGEEETGGDTPLILERPDPHNAS